MCSRRHAGSALRALLALTMLWSAACAGGSDDSSAAVITTASELAPGDACPAGGTVILSGVDADGDGALIGDEVERTFNVCNGETGAVLSRTEDAGDACPNGGTAVAFGTDLDGDGVLGDDEVADTTAICDALGSLISVSTIVGDPCPLRGLRIDSGVDDDGDGVLGAGEIDTTQYVCDGVDIGVQAGIGQDLTISALVSEGWRVCYQQPYAASGPALSTAAALRAACADAGSYLIAGCTDDAADPDVLVVAAGDEAAVVLPALDDPAGPGDFRLGEGNVGWYLSEDWSFGFFEGGDGVERDSADTSAGIFPDRRMSWHTHENIGGYRCGAAAGLNESADYTKVILAR